MVQGIHTNDGIVFMTFFLQGVNDLLLHLIAIIIHDVEHAFYGRRDPMVCAARYARRKRIMKLVESNKSTIDRMHIYGVVRMRHIVSSHLQLWMIL